MADLFLRGFATAVLLIALVTALGVGLINFKTDLLAQVAASCFRATRSETYSPTCQSAAYSPNAPCFAALHRADRCHRRDRRSSFPAWLRPDERSALETEIAPARIREPESTRC
jgi:hypothetical protein